MALVLEKRMVVSFKIMETNAGLGQRTGLIVNFDALTGNEDKEQEYC